MHTVHKGLLSCFNGLRFYKRKKAPVQNLKVVHCKMDEEDLFDEFGNYIGPDREVDEPSHEYVDAGYQDQQGDNMMEGEEEEVNQRFAMVSIDRCKKILSAVPLFMFVFSVKSDCVA